MFISFFFFREIRECLKLDPDHKQCHSHYKIVKKIERLVVDSQSAINIKDFPSSIQFAKKVIIVFFFFKLFLKLKSFKFWLSSFNNLNLFY